MNILVKFIMGTAAGCCLFLGVLRAAEPDKVRPVRDPLPVAGAIDRELEKKLAEAKVTPAGAADDAEFCRRAYLDITGRLPTIEQAVAFLDSKDPDKRRKLIDQLLDSENYGKHFGVIWSDTIVKRDDNNRALRTEGFKAWLADNFNKNRGWHEIVTDLLTAEGGTDKNPAGVFFLANRDMDRISPAKITGSMSNLFLGVSMQCAECHNHPFICDWKQKDFWGMAAFFGHVRTGGVVRTTAGAFSISESGEAQGRGNTAVARALPGPNIAIPDAVDPRKTVGTVRAKFFEAEEPALPDKPPYRAVFAAWVTSTENKFFAPTMVNRMWAHFLARGIVNPIEEFHKDNPPSHPELLQLLSKEFRDSGHDLKHLIRCICNSKVYQRTSQPPKGEIDPQLFAHMPVKVMSAEVLYDALCQAMGESSLGADSVPRTGGAAALRGQPQGARERFVAFFTTRDEGDEATEFGLGIPQFLRLMNSAQFNKGGPIIDQLTKDNASREKVIEGMVLATWSRRPSEMELKKLSAYAAKKENAREGYNGVLWILINSAEFICIR